MVDELVSKLVSIPRDCSNGNCELAAGGNDDGNVGAATGDGNVGAATSDGNDDGIRL